MLRVWKALIVACVSLSFPALLLGPALFSPPRARANAACPIGWQIVPSPQVGSRPFSFTSLKVIVADDVWAIGKYWQHGLQRTLTLHWDGIQWQYIAAPPSPDYDGLTHIDASSSNNVWAFSSYATLLRWDGHAWQTNPRHPKGDLQDVSVLAPDNVWLLLGTSIFSSFRRWNGERWAEYPAPDTANGDRGLHALYALSPDDIWAVGQYYVYYPDYGSFAVHWDGETWAQIQTLPQDQARLVAVHGSATNDVWAVGSKMGEPYSLHWDGTQWNHIPIPSPNIQGFELKKVLSFAPNDAWTVGSAYQSDGPDSILYHWDGQQWQMVNAPRRGAIMDLDGTSSNDLWAVSKAGWIAHWDGAAWKIVPTPDIGDGAGLVSVDGVTKNNVWAVGSFYDGTTDRTLIQQWDGFVWNIVPSPNRGQDSNRLTVVKAFDANQAWALGNAADEPLLLQWNGAAWHEHALPNSPKLALLTLDGSALDDVWIGGQTNDAPFAARWDGAQWLDMTPPNIPPDSEIRRLVVKAPNETYAMAQTFYTLSGSFVQHNLFHILKWDGATWTILGVYDFEQRNHGWLPTLRDLTAPTANDVWLVGDATDYVLGTSLFARRWNGMEWYSQPPPPDAGKFAYIARITHDTVGQVWALGSQERYYFGPAAPLLGAWDGAQWQMLAHEAFDDDTRLSALAFVEDEIWAVGSANDNSFILHGAGCAQLPAAPKLRAPKKDATLAKKKPTLLWEDAAGTLYAEIEFQDGTDKKTRSTFVARHSAYKFTIPLEAEHEYRWRVRDCNAAGCGDWSPWRTFQIK